MKYFKYLLTIGLLAFCINAEAQYYEEVIYLTNGSVIRGDVIKQTKEEIKIQIAGGSILVYKMSEVDRITKEEKKEKEKRRTKDFTVQDTGFYHAVSFGLLPGQGEFGNFAFGGSLHYVFGYQYKPIIGVGLGVGTDSYIYSEIRNIIPVYLEARGYLKKQPFAPYYSVQAGYGFALVNDTWNMTDASGGLMIHPKIGFRFPSRTNAAFTAEIGYLFQQASFTFDDWQGRYQDDVNFRRISVRFGVLF
ncbi:MAG: hypothetical protein AB8G11_12465 [Saprospiraceae bacterium]